MKKSSIIAVAIIYLVSIILIGFLGVRMKVYDEVLYVENIVWDYSEYENKTTQEISDLAHKLIKENLENLPKY